MTAQNVLNSPIVMRHETYLGHFFHSPKDGLKTLLQTLWVLDWSSKIRFIFMETGFSKRRKLRPKLIVSLGEGFQFYSDCVQKARLSWVHFLSIPLCVGLQTQNQLWPVLDPKDSPLSGKLRQFLLDFPLVLVPLATEVPAKRTYQFPKIGWIVRFRLTFRENSTSPKIFLNYGKGYPNFPFWKLPL